MLRCAGVLLRRQVRWCLAGLYRNTRLSLGGCGFTLSVIQCGLTNWRASNDFGLRAKLAQGHETFAAQAPTYGRRFGATFS
jgi:hypothetical protein